MNLHQILEIRKNYPKLRFIVAHIGRAYTKEDVEDIMYNNAKRLIEGAKKGYLRKINITKWIYSIDSKRAYV